MSSSQAPFLFIFESEMRAIALEASKHPNLETGGDLYGLWTHGNRPVVFLATGPGPKSSATATEFQQDHEYIMQCEAKLYQDFGIQYLGDWHSHHKLNLPRPSIGDIDRIHRYATKTARERMAEIIVTHTVEQTLSGQQKEQINCYSYQDAYKCQPMPVSLSLFDEKESPIRSKLTYQNAQILRCVWDWKTFPSEKIIYNQTAQTAEPTCKTTNYSSEKILEELKRKLGSLVRKNNDYKYQSLENGNIVLSIPVPDYENIFFICEVSPFKIIDVLFLDKHTDEKKSLRDELKLDLENINKKSNAIEVVIKQISP